MGLLNIYSPSMGYSKPVCRISTGSFHSTQNRHANLFRLSASFEVVETGLDSTYRLSTGFVVLKTGLPNVYSFWGCQTGYNSSTDTSQGLQRSKLPCQTITYGASTTFQNRLGKHLQAFNWLFSSQISLDAFNWLCSYLNVFIEHLQSSTGSAVVKMCMTIFHRH